MHILTYLLDDVINDLNGSVVYSKCDLQKAYHQLVLSESSRYITTFSTHAGLFRYKRLNFGISSTSEIFQHTISQVLHGISGVKNISDDIIVYGADAAEVHHEEPPPASDNELQQSSHEDGASLQDVEPSSLLLSSDEPSTSNKQPPTATCEILGCPVSPTLCVHAILQQQVQFPLWIFDRILRNRGL